LRVARYGIPYYRLQARPASLGSAFYSEAYFTPLLGRADFFVLSTPKAPGDPPGPGVRLLRPRLGPDEHARAASEALREIRERAYRGPSFDFGGLTGTFKALLQYMTGRRPRAEEVARPTESLPWSLAYDYLRSVLGAASAEGFTADMTPVYFTLILRETPAGFEAYLARGGSQVRFRVLEMLASRYPEVEREVERLLDQG